MHSVETRCVHTRHKWRHGQQNQPLYRTGVTETAGGPRPRLASRTFRTRRKTAEPITAAESGRLCLPHAKAKGYTLNTQRRKNQRKQFRNRYYCLINTLHCMQHGASPIRGPKRNMCSPKQQTRKRKRTRRKPKLLSTIQNSGMRRLKRYTHRCSRRCR